MRSLQSLYVVLILAAVAAWGGGALQAQTTGVSGQILTQINTGAGTNGADQLQVTLQLFAQGEAFNIGTTTLMLTFNNAALSIPSGATTSEALTDGTDYAYRDPFASSFLYNKAVTLFSAANRLSVNMELPIDNTGSPVLTTGTPIIDLFFDITDPSQTSMLTWVTANDPNPTVIFDEGNVNAVALGSFLGDNSVLPVELVSLGAVADDAAIHVRWETASEVNFAGFGIEVQRGGGAWEEEAFVEARGGSAFGARYDYTLQNVPAGTYAIRLREVDTDGTIAYSPTVEVQVEVIAALVQSAVYPNPFHGSAQVDVALSEAQYLTAELYDMRGRRLRQLYAGHVAAHQTLTLRVDGEALPAGVYLVQFTTDGFTAHQRLVHR
ncbi:MAG: T9SS type A sorting domain-containing protein [Bacteroidota bacterium]